MQQPQPTPLTAHKLDWNAVQIAAFRWWLRDSKSAFAARLKVSRHSVAAWEGGERKPDSWNLRALDRLAAAREFYG